MASIDFVNVTKSFQKNVIIENLNLHIEEGKFTVLVGPSGCGKTTLLRMIAGIEKQTSGAVRIGGRDVTHVPPGKRGVAMVFQNYALYPTMTVRENIEFGLKNNGLKKSERERLIESIGETVGLSAYLNRKPASLSGGQRQRVALARAMVKKPSVFLMDEPLSNLDAKLRGQMRIELIELHRQLGATFVYVTHDQVEAMSMADTVVLMDSGVVQQKAPPEIMYREPDNVFAAQFIGVPPMNVAEHELDGVKFGFRPESAHLTLEPSEMHYNERGIIVTREMLGSETIYQVRTSRQSFMVKSATYSHAINQEVYIGVPEDGLYLFGADGARLRPDHAKHGEYLRMLRGISYAR
ncbi:ABC transporter ATP-binding protein [Paenibacillus sp. TRM 82003]|nr:ABC transporter ATP-binding protein [Paenibacillus sp. TRM 82003]